MLAGRELSDRRMQLDSLDGLRGVAVLIVVVSHLSNSGMYLLPLVNLRGYGKSGVYLFFLLSSFLLTYPFLLKGREALDRMYLANYALRRFLRIYPLYLCYLLLALSTTFLFARWSPSLGGIPFPLSPAEFIEHVVLRQGKGVTWSILVEFRYYFFLPLLALLLSVVLKNKLIPALLLTVALISIAQFLWPQSGIVSNDLRLGPYLPIFFMGALLAVLYLRWQQTELHQQQALGLWVQIAGAVAMLLLVLSIPSVASFVSSTTVAPGYFHRQIILYGLLWSTVVFAAIATPGPLRIVFESPVLRYVGFISFSVYLLHVVVMDLFTRFVPQTAAQGWLILLATIAVSHLSWRLIEKPTSKIRLHKPAAL